MRSAILLCLAPLLLAACSTQPDYRATETPPPTVASVDLERYAGLWHEIARYPNGFQRDCGATTARYTLRDDGAVTVLNTCVLLSDPSRTKQAEGRARVVDGSGGSKLKVRFAPAWIPFAEGDYWILHLEPDYSAALVGDSEGKYLWILAREPELAQATQGRILARAEELGFRTDPLIYSGG